MIFEQVKKIYNVSVRTRYAVAAGALFVTLLAALVSVLNGQVKQAQIRQMQHQAMQAALFSCAAHPAGVARQQCIAQLNRGSAPDFTQLAEVELHADVQPEQPRLLAKQAAAKGQAGLAPRDLTETAFVRRFD